MDWPGRESRQCFELLSWKVDVEWCGFLFSDSNRVEPELSPGDIDWETLATSLGLVKKLPVTSNEVPSCGRVLKVSGVLLLLGLGSYLCYKLYRVWSYQQSHHAAGPGREDNTRPPSSSFAHGTPAFSYHHMSSSSASINDLLNVKTRYFGPLNFNNDDNYSESEMIQAQELSNPLESQRRAKEKKRRKHKLSSPPSVGSGSSRRGWLLHKLQALTPGSCTQSNGEESGCSRVSTGTSSSQSSPVSYPRQHSLSRDLSFDSLGLFSYNRRQGSLDSMSSELSMEMPSFADQTAESVTVARLDKLQEEIDQLKSNCQLMDEEFETVKGNRNLPGLSDLMEAAEHDNPTEQDIIRQQSARACFKGLYSLTTINRSMSMDLSQDEDSPQSSNQFGLSQLTEEEHLPSLEWDEEYEQDTWADDATNANTTALPPSSPNPSSKLDTSGYGSKCDMSASLTGSQFSCFESPTSNGEDISDAINNELIRSMSCESQTEMWSMTESVSSDLDSPLSETTSFRHANIGCKKDIMSYARQEWTGNTPKAQTIIRVR